MLNNLTIKARLVFVLTFLGLQLLIGAVVGVSSLYYANETMKSMYGDRVVALGQLDKVIRLLNLNQLEVAKAATDDAEGIRQSLEHIEDNRRQLDAVWDEYMATYLTPREKQLADEFQHDRKAFLDEALLPAVAALRQGDLPQARTLVHGAMAQRFLPVRKGINALISLQLEVAKGEYADSQATYERVRNVCIAGILLGLALSACVGVWLVRAISAPLDNAVTVAGAVAAGDLTRTIAVTSRNETGRLLQALKDMNEGLVRIVTEVRSSTAGIATASSQIASGNHDLSARTEQQAASLEETASSMEELTATIKQNADHASEANRLADSASRVATEGGEVVAQVVETMHAIQVASSRIADITGVIDGIAFQTNILALNAAVEAARAGEQGRGFAVVATEVRNLAQRSATAAKEIKVLIDDSTAKVQTGSALANKAGATMTDVVASVGRVTGIMAEISEATREQSVGVEQISQMVMQMDQVTQQNAALVEEAAAASEAMRQQAAHLAELVSVFKVAGRTPEPQARMRLPSPV